MHRQVQFRVRKDLEPQQQLRVIKLKGSLISKGYTEIIHIMDQDEQYHINTFETQADKRNEVQQYIEAFISEQNLSQTISIDYPA
ncbi:hypothetical protein [Flavobacterium phragmitis]|uniref:Uncharacterized protein n=1 Tax=Flavobacterium phragmitis TaxID=739143 RepID=A0A1I1LN16_9FLAO|nr:hypothetical protein [Flavobacterium phragmitis]SFC74607.1 hypothetical protein SAMN05216297_102120 [Flavobacterium phragmitis]